jgi:hypothetical protein
MSITDRMSSNVARSAAICSEKSSSIMSSPAYRAGLGARLARLARWRNIEWP